ncbi:MAG TPA: xanthine dehydrogenase family protein subunit M [Xanthobacteraceae bacterium]
MRPFTLERPRDLLEIVALGAEAGRNDAEAEYIAGGTEMLQLLKDGVRSPVVLVDLLAHDGLDGRIEQRDGVLRLGARATMAETADHPLVRQHMPFVSQALLLSASQQVRNAATVAGNLLQRTRCSYFRDIGFAACNKRAPASGCAALDGANRMHAILGTSEHCIATHASDFAVPLVALDATVRLRAGQRDRGLPLAAFHRLPGDSPHIEAAIEPGEVITAIEIPLLPAARRSHYLKVRDRMSFEFALVSAAVALDIDGGAIREARIACGGVGTKPWRMPTVEAALRGRPPTTESFRDAAARAGEGALPRTHNGFKVELMQRTIARALETVAALP